MKKKPLTLKRRLAYYGLLILIVAVVVETGAYLAVGYLGRKGIVYTPPTPEGYEAYRAKRDPILGWPVPSSFGVRDRDVSGSRIEPAFPDPAQHACIALYGDSFTWAKDVADASAWGNILAKMLHCRVANFGVGAYGTDQAYLRYKYYHQDDAGIVVLGHLSENIIRNVTQFFNLLYGGQDYGFKPRFILDEKGGLKYIPLPDLSLDEFSQMAHHPKRFLTHDYFCGHGEIGAYEAGFPYTFSALKALKHFRLRAKLAGKSVWTDFYRQDHPSHALQITTLIITSFYREVRARGAHPVIVVFPMIADITEYRRTRHWVYQPLLDNLRRAGIEALNMGTAMNDYLGARDPCLLFTNCRNGHYNEEGNRLVARQVKAFLQARKLIKG